ncbi:MAG: DUF3634 family protein [Planctomycetota bacterium]|nr:DUF3634 family protein [Planctomycetota bacterium]
MLELLTRIIRVLFPPAFTITLEEGVARSTQGKVTGRAVSGFTDVAKQQGIAKGRIYGVRRGKTVLLRFSSNIPSSARQRFRNVWQMTK